MPTFGALAVLQVMSLSYLETLEELPACLGLLTSLRTLKLLWLDHLKKLPSAIGELTGLQELSIQHCALMDMPRSIVALTALRTLRSGPEVWGPSCCGQRKRAMSDR